MKKNTGVLSCVGLNSFSGAAAAEIGVRDLLSASLLSAVQRLGQESGFRETFEL